jgi:hypothetical protein
MKLRFINKYFDVNNFFSILYELYMQYMQSCQHFWFVCLFVCWMVFNATFSNISVILWRSILLMEEIVGPGENHRPVASH